MDEVGRSLERSGERSFLPNRAYHVDAAHVRQPKWICPSIELGGQQPETQPDAGGVVSLFEHIVSRTSSKANRTLTTTIR